MKRWPWHIILMIVAASLVLVGVAPLAYLFWWGNAHNIEPLSVPLSLKSGEYTSPFFTTDLDDTYQIQIYFLPQHLVPLDLDWKVVDDRGAVIQSGAYREHIGGNEANIGEYRPKRGSRQRIIVNIHHDVDAAAGSDLKLHIGLPEDTLRLAYGSAAAIGWASFFAGSGAIVLLVLLIWRAMRAAVT